jgi:glycosyltransferase involved in cell wall biosynthesis
VTLTPPRETRRPRSRLLYISAAFPPYAAPEADFALQQCVHFAEAGVEVHVLTTRREGVVQPPGVHVHAVMETWSWRELGRLVSVVRRVRPDAGLLYFLGWLYSYRLMVTVAPLVLKASDRGTRFVTYFSNLGEGGAKADDLVNRVRRLAFRALGRLRYGALLPLSDRLVVFTEIHADKLAQVHPSLRDKTAVIPPPPLIRVLPDEPDVREAGRRALGVPEDAFLFTYFGRLLPRKGIETLLRAFADVAEQLPGARLAFVGGYHSTDAWFTRPQYADELEALVDELGIGERLAWSGEYEWDSDAPSQYLRAADVAVLPFAGGVSLLNSSFAAVCVHGLPVVTTTRSTGAEAPIAHGRNTFLVPVEDPDALRDALLVVHADPGLRRQLGAGAARLAEACFSWRRALEQQLLYLGLAGGVDGTHPKGP